jgi:quercetin dioxygenase-like cupin family protein
MKTTFAAAMILAILTVAPASAEQMEVSAEATRPAVKGSAFNFMGAVTVTPLFAGKPGMSATAGLVAFEPGARSAWHTHPAGQMLIVTEGIGWVQEEGGLKREMKKGDVVWTPPGVKHWHGASATGTMSHIAITNIVEGKNVDWMEQVTDEQYLH